MMVGSSLYPRPCRTIQPREPKRAFGSIETKIITPGSPARFLSHLNISFHLTESQRLDLARRKTGIFQMRLWRLTFKGTLAVSRGTSALDLPNLPALPLFHVMPPTRLLTHFSLSQANRHRGSRCCIAISNDHMSGLLWNRGGK